MTKRKTPTESFSRKVTYWLGVAAVGMVVGLSLQFARAWVEPGSTPPAGNVAGPITTGPAFQYKTGPLEVRGYSDIRQPSDSTLRRLAPNTAPQGLNYISDANAGSFITLYEGRSGRPTGTLYGDADPTRQWFGLMDAQGRFVFLSKLNDYLRFRINNSDKMTILNNGNVGIGTTSPDGMLSVNVPANRRGIESLTSTAGNTHLPWSDNWNYISGNGVIFRDASNIEKVRINAITGNVGIGTTNPSHRLDVNGVINTYSGGTYNQGALRLGQHTLNSNATWLYLGDQNGTVYGGRGIAADYLWANSALYTNGPVLRGDGNTIIDANGGWHRTYGATGWYNQTYSGGWYMQDTTWVRSYLNKNVYTGGEMQATTVRGNSNVCIGSDCRSSWPGGATAPATASWKSIINVVSNTASWQNTLSYPVHVSAVGGNSVHNPCKLALTVSGVKMYEVVNNNDNRYKSCGGHTIVPPGATLSVDATPYGGGPAIITAYAFY